MGQIQAAESAETGKWGGTSPPWHRRRPRRERDFSKFSQEVSGKAGIALSPDLLLQAPYTELYLVVLKM